ncbi:MAG: hypothetical protein GX575_13720 [Candidatus Anammoximicrobium sp.]|nr:hypothetical protein [Candidatus Anammoximicrobium sp.]
MTATAPTRRAHFEVANPQAQPTREWVRCIARLLLAHVDRQIAAERRLAERDADENEAGRDEG